jgi:transposase
MPNFIPYDLNQSEMVVINYLDQLQPGTFEHAIHHLIEHRLDLSVFFPAYQNDATGRYAYNPAILLKIVLFAYSKGITSSREIQWNCQNNITFMALACGEVPHFTTIAAFISGHAEQVEAIFEQVLLICDADGLLGKELFAIDGCKMSSNAAKEWSGTFKELKEKRNKIRRQIKHCIQEHKKTDKRSSDGKERARRLQQKADTLNKAADRIDEFLAAEQPKIGQGKTKKEIKSNITDNESAKMTTSKGTIQGYNGVATVDSKHQIIVDAQAFGHGQEHHTLTPVVTVIKERFKRLGIKNNIFTPKGTKLTADTGFSNEKNNEFLYKHGINAYIPDNQFRRRDSQFETQKKKYGKRKQEGKPKQSTTYFSQDDFKFNKRWITCICPAGEKLTLSRVADNGYGKETAYFEGRLLQCRNCPLKEQCMKNAPAADQTYRSGRQVSFIIGQVKNKKNYTDWMKKRIDAPKGKDIYSKRMSVVEPVFANIGTNKGLNRFSLRGKTKVQAQWQLYGLIHNIEKWMNYGPMAV